MRRVRAPLALLCAVGAVALGLVAPSADSQQAPGQTSETAAGSEVARGHNFFEEGCSSCHGFDGGGVENRGPNLHGAGAEAADFYLRTGRMPLNAPGEEPRRADPAYDDADISALIAYVSSLGGPPIPDVDPSRGSVSDGQSLFTSYCSGCHAITGEGGVVVGAQAPNLSGVTPTDIGEAIRVGPFLMPAFGRRQLSDADVDSIARYVDEVVDHPNDAGGWGIGHIGPVPEGMVAWLLAAVALLLVARIIGERNEDPS